MASRLDTDPRATEALLNALVAIGVLEKRDGTFQNTDLAAEHLAAGGEHDSRAAIMHTVHLWPRWSTLTDCVREGTSVMRRARARDDDWTEAFIAAMHRNAADRAPRVVEAIGVDGVRRVLDVGGGSGAYSIAFARAEPALEVDILDVPDVVPIAQRHIQEAGVTDRVRPRAGDFRTDDLGHGDYDLVFLSAICHMNGPEENRRLLEKAFGALAPAGRIVIQDFILDADKTAPAMGALFALNMLVGTRAGSSYSEPEYADWLRDAGFDDVRRLPLPGSTDLMVGRRP